MEQTDRVARLEELFASLAQRVEALERRSSGASPPTPARPPQSSRVTRMREAVAPPEPEAREAQVEPPPRPVRQAPARRERAPGRARGDIGDVERTVGAKVFAIAGALVVMAAAALFLKLAWDRGWLELVPDISKVGASMAFGFALLVAGEWARRKINTHAAAGLSAAGVGVVYASAYSAYALFGLVGPAGAFLALVGSAALGVLVSARARLASVAVVSLVGGYAAPLLLGEAESHPATLPAYWLGLLVVGLTLSAWRGGWFTTLRVLVWWGTVLFGGLWAHQFGVEHPAIALGFLAIAWALVHAELLASARAGRLTETPRWIRPLAPDDSWWIFRPFGSSLTMSAWAAGLAGFVLDSAYALDWLAPAGGFVVTAMLAIPLIGHLRALRDRPETDLERLGVVFAVEAGAFLFATITLALAGWMEHAAWLGLAVASLVAGRWIGARGFDVYGVVVLTVATLAILATGWWVQPSISSVTPFGLVVTEGGVLALCAGAAWIAGACIVRMNARRGWSAMRAGAAVGVLLVGMSILHQDADARALSVALLALSVIVYHARRVAGRLSFDQIAGVPLAMATLAGLAAYPAMEWLDRADPVAMHPGMWLGLAISLAGACMGVGLMRRSTEGSGTRGVGVFVTTCAALLAFGVTSMEMARSASLVISDPTSQRAAVSIWWGVLGVACIGAGFWRRLAVVRHTGMGLLALATAKAAMFDLAFVSAELRVVSFLVLGLLLLGVGVAYARVSARLGRSEADGSVEALV